MPDPGRGAVLSRSNTCAIVARGHEPPLPRRGRTTRQQRRLAEARGRGDLQSLTAEQLQLGVRVVSLAPERSPMRALAWLRFGDTEIRCTVQVKRWTADAVGVELEAGKERLRCWVWQGAVEAVEGPGAAP